MDERADSRRAAGSRRRFLQQAGLFGLTLGAGGRLAQICDAASVAPSGEEPLYHLPLITRVIPSSGEHVPAIGLGTDKFRERQSTAIRDEIDHLQRLGGRLIDTSSDYGQSEAVLGDALQALGLGGRMFVATKLTAGGQGFGGDGVGGTASFERSLKRLHTSRVDLLQVHNLDGVDELMPLMQGWKQAGRVRYLGITTSVGDQHSEMMGHMRRYPLDFIQVDYSLDNREAAQGVLPLAQSRGIAVLVNVPFGFGATLSQAQRRPLPSWAADIDVSSWGQFLLKYVISHPAVTCAIPGSTQTAHLVDNQGAARGRLPDAAMRRKMEQYWDTA